MAVTTEEIRRLREATGAGVMDCKRALTEADGDFEGAQKVLRARGALMAEKKAGREASQGLVESYLHAGRVGALVEVNCETDFVARSDEFRQLARELAMQIAAMNPKRVGNEDGQDGEGLDQQDALLTQEFIIRESGRTVQERINDTVARVGERIVVRRFARYELGA